MALIVMLVTCLTGCGSSDSASESSPEEESTVSTTESTMGSEAQVSITASGAASGTFDTVTNCSTTRGAGEMLLITVTGTLNGSPATLTIDQDTFASSVYVYPTDPAPAPGTDLRSDIGYDENAAQGSWQFFSVNPGNLVGDAGGSIGIVETGGNTLDVTMDVKYGTTDASGPLAVKGEFTCTETA